MKITSEVITQEANVSGRCECDAVGKTQQNKNNNTFMNVNLKIITQKTSFPTNPAWHDNKRPILTIIIMAGDVPTTLHH